MAATLELFTFIVALFTLRKGDDDFYELALSQEFCWHDGHALLLGGGKSIDLLAAYKELSHRSIDAASICLTSDV